MIKLELAQQLQEAGLSWQPKERDCFALPERGMDEQVFVVSPVPALVQLLNGYPVVAFQASAEWALDYVMLAEAVWLPLESQLREALAAAMHPEAELRLEREATGYSCTAGLPGSEARYEGPDAETAYGRALLGALTGQAQ